MLQAVTQTIEMSAHTLVHSEQIGVRSTLPRAISRLLKCIGYEESLPSCELAGKLARELAVCGSKSDRQTLTATAELQSNLSIFGKILCTMHMHALPWPAHSPCRGVS